MAAQGQQQTVRAEDVAHMGITEVLLHAPFIFRQYRRLVASLKTQRLAVAVLIDFPDVNFRLAKHLHRLGVPVVWFVSPQLWAWKRRRLLWVQQRVDKMLVIFPFEEVFYRERGVDAEFVGHPLASQSHSYSSREDYSAAHGLDPAKTWIALLPGSRWKEVRANLPALHELAVSDLIASAAAHTTFDDSGLHSPPDPAAHTQFEFLLPVASTIDAAKLSTFLAQLNAQHLRYFGPENATPPAAPRLTLVPDAREALHFARASVVASGTATVLAAIVGNPFVVVYRVSALTFFLAKRLVRYPPELAAPRDLAGNPPVAMVNLIAGRRVVPELLQGAFTAANVASALAPLLADTPQRATQIAALAEVRSHLLAPGPTSRRLSPIDRVAETVLGLLEL
jgi:lipid-A-disaccharide synthase